MGFIVVESRQGLLVNKEMDDYTIINKEMDGKPINRFSEAKSLGVQIDEHLTWAPHVENISKKIASAIGALKRVRQFIDTGTVLKIYEALIQLQFDYCSIVWDSVNNTLNDKLQKLQNRAARTITKSNSYNASSSKLFTKLDWDDLSTHRKKTQSRFDV